MTDLSIVLPRFETQNYAHLIPSLEKNLVNTTDLLTLDALEIAKRAHLPSQDVKKLCTAVLEALQCDLQLSENRPEKVDYGLKHTGKEVLGRWRTISTLDEKVDAALGGGIPTGYITEVTGERYRLYSSS